MRNVTKVPLSERTAALQRATETLTDIAPETEIRDAREVLARIDERTALSGEHTVIGLFGNTGSGKSTLMNALVGKEISRAAVRRPTTAQPVAAVLRSAGSDALLDWLEVSDRHHLDGSGVLLDKAASTPQTRRERREGVSAPGLILVDLPDLDSVEAANRQIAERMTGMVDVLVWVTDPQKYADAVLHQDFVQPFASHDAVSVLVLNQMDRVRSAERDGVIASLTQLARQGGLSTAPVFGVSAETGEGVDELRAFFLDIARRQETVAARHRADIQRAATALQAAADPSGLPAQSQRNDSEALIEDLAAAARVEPVAKAVGASYRHQAGKRVGWPPLRWLARFRPDPLQRWNIGQGRDLASVQRTSMPEPDAATQARASQGVRRFADAASSGGSDPWRAAIRRSARRREQELPAALDLAVGGADLRANRRDWWWVVLNVLQWLAVLSWVVGLGWLAVNAILLAAAFPQMPVPMITDLGVPIPVPVALIVIGVAAGVLLAILGRVAAGLAGMAARSRARRILRGRVREVAEDYVVSEVDAMLAAANETTRDLALAHGTPAR